MDLLFVTGSEGKLREIQSVLPKVKQLSIDLVEIQELDPKKIIEAKLREARTQTQEALMVEDTSLSLNCLNGLPGPQIKWFLQALGKEGLAELALKYSDQSAEARTIIGYMDANGTTRFFEGFCSGRIVAPRGTGGFGWDQIFQPNGDTKTFGEMSLEEKERYSMRKQAAEKLKKFLAG